MSQETGPWRTAAFALAISLAAANARGQTCEQLAAGLASLDLSKGQELIDMVADSPVGPVVATGLGPVRVPRAGR